MSRQEIKLSLGKIINYLKLESVSILKMRHLLDEYLSVDTGRHGCPTKDDDRLRRIVECLGYFYGAKTEDEIISIAKEDRILTPAYFINTCKSLTKLIIMTGDDAPLFAIGIFAGALEKEAEYLFKKRKGELLRPIDNVVAKLSTNPLTAESQKGADEKQEPKLAENAHMKADQERLRQETESARIAEEESRRRQKVATVPDRKISFEGLKFRGAQGGAEYHLGARLGVGGFGSVFDATLSRSGQLDARVAVKIFLIEEADHDGNQIFDHATITRKLNELVTQVAERHECIVSTPRHGIGSVDLRGQLGVFMEMELAAHDLLHTARRGRMPPDDIRSLVIDVCRGLVFLHDRPNPIVHRDIKPGNILWFAEQRRWKLGDLGLARELSQPGQLTRTAQIGTPVYMSPEAFRGEVGSGSDMWALGAMIAELLTGRVPFGHGVGEVYQVMYQILEGQPDFGGIPLPAPFDRIVTGCLNKDWRHRLTARQVLDMLLD